VTAEPPPLDQILYPPVEPYATHRLAVADGQILYVEESGRPSGKPVVFLHGGPGGGTDPQQRRFFDPERYRIVLFDQRGCGRSTPHVADPGTDLSVNTTWHLVADIEAIRTYLGIERWQVFGGSWGSALALAYAETHPERVTELVLRGVFTLRRAELDWFYNGAAGFMAPAAWEGFCAPLRAAGHEPVRWLDPAGVPPDLAAQPRRADAAPALAPGSAPQFNDNIARYHDLLWDLDPAVATAAAVAWTLWETATTALEVPAERLAHTAADTRAALAFARIENHYFFHRGFYPEGHLIAQVDRIRHLPGVIVQGAYDLCCPARTAWDLAAAWPEATCQIVHAGHSVFEPAIAAALVAATARFASASAGAPA
jgi:proline iminopeptidase